MMMSEILYMILAFLVGTALGLFFFGGLWFTVIKAFGTKTPALWFFTSFFLRIGIVLIGFYYIVQEGLKPLIICLIAFMLARVFVTFLTKSTDKNQTREELYHET
jgi:F1F0 ATPase subunit 2